MRPRLFTADNSNESKVHVFVKRASMRPRLFTADNLTDGAVTRFMGVLK